MQFVAQDAEEAVVAAAEEDVPVRGAEGFVGDDGGWGELWLVMWSKLKVEG